MKFSPRLASLFALLACICSLAPAPPARAQAHRHTTPQTITPSPTISDPKSSPNTSLPPTPRERRAQAYAKLLEGQRYLGGAFSGGGVTREAVNRAAQAFQQAGALDPTLAEAHTALAEINFFFLDDLKQAEREAAAATGIDPDNFGAHRVLSRIYSLSAGLDESKLDRAAAERAIKELHEVVRLDKNDPEAWALLGEFYQLTGREREAFDAFRQWAAAPPAVDARFYQIITQGRELTPDAAEARLGEALLRAGRTDEAVAAFRQAISINPDNRRYPQLLAQVVEVGGNDHGVIAELQRMTTANPKNTAAVGLLAQTQARAGRVDDAAATLRAAIKERKGGERLSLLNELAQVFAGALRYDEAAAAYEEILRARDIGQTPLTDDVNKQIAADVLPHIISLQRQAGHTNEALASIERMRKLLGADDASADYQYVLLLREQGKRTEALAAIHAARVKYPEQPAFLRLEAVTLAELNRVDEATELLRGQLNGKSENDYQSYLLIANVLLDAGRGAEAVAAARKALELTPPDQPQLMAQSLVMLSSAQERAGDLKGAEGSLRLLLAKDPDNATALNNLGYFFAERNEHLDEALAMIQRAVKSDPSNASFLDSLGWVYFKLGKLDEAERYLTDAARRSDKSATIQEHLGDLYQRSGQLDLARAAWRRALALALENSSTARLKGKLNGEGTRK